MSFYIGVDGGGTKTAYALFDEEKNIVAEVKTEGSNHENLEGSFDEVKALLARARTDGWATRVGMKFPVTVTTGKDLLNWVSIRPNSTFYSLRFDGVIDDESFEEFVGRMREKAVYKLLDYYVTASSVNEQEFLTKYIRRILR